MTKITTRIERIGEPRGKHWAKQITRIDPSKTNGYALVGEWVRMDESVELDEGAVVVAYDSMTASTRPPYTATVRVFNATARGVAEVERIETQDRGWALLIRPQVEALLPHRGERWFKLVLTERQLELCVLGLETLNAGDPLAERENEAALNAVRAAEEIT